jgi:RNA polymerase sigma factor (sigma-70 family)
MQTKSDASLLRDYAVNGAEDAFAEIVHRHTNLVYSAALRQVDSPDVAAEVAQQVFIDLAKRSRELSSRLNAEASLVGWLCRAARNISLNHRRDEFRRRVREELAMENLNANEPSAPDWENLRPVLDDAMSELDESEYDAVVMRFYRNLDFRSVGQALGVTDDTAQKRVSRALEKLRQNLCRRGVTTTAAALAAVLSSKAVQAAPAGLASCIVSAAATAHPAVASTAAAISKSILMTTIQKAAVAAVLATAVGTGIYQAHRATALQQQADALTAGHEALTQQLQNERDESARQLAAARRQIAPPSNSADHKEVIRLRAQVGLLRDQLARLQSSLDNPTSIDMKAWLDRVQKLKARLAENASRSIPEFQLLTDQDWLDAVRNVKQLDTDADYDQAFSQLRNAARSEFSGSVSSALHAFATANNGSLPSDFSQLQSYFATAPDDSVLQNYQFSSPGVITSKPGSLIDDNGNYYSSEIKVSMDGISSSNTSEDSLHQAIASYLAANNNAPLTDPSQLVPYVTTPAEQQALQKILQSQNGRSTAP